MRKRGRERERESEKVSERERKILRGDVCIWSNGDGCDAGKREWKQKGWML